MNDAIRTSLDLRRQTLDRLRAVLVERLKVRCEPEDIDPDVPLFGTGLRLDSIDAVELVVAVEEAFGLRLLNGAPTRLGPAAVRTLNSLVDFVLERTHERRQ